MILKPTEREKNDINSKFIWRQKKKKRKKKEKSRWVK